VRRAGTRRATAQQGTHQMCLQVPCMSVGRPPPGCSAGTTDAAGADAARPPPPAMRAPMGSACPRSTCARVGGVRVCSVPATGGCVRCGNARALSAGHGHGMSPSLLPLCAPRHPHLPRVPCLAIRVDQLVCVHVGGGCARARTRARAWAFRGAPPRRERHAAAPLSSRRPPAPPPPPRAHAASTHAPAGWLTDATQLCTRKRMRMRMRMLCSMLQCTQGRCRLTERHIQRRQLAAGHLRCCVRGQRARCSVHVRACVCWGGGGEGGGQGVARARACVLPSGCAERRRCCGDRCACSVCHLSHHTRGGGGGKGQPRPHTAQLPAAACMRHPSPTPSHPPTHTHARACARNSSLPATRRHAPVCCALARIAALKSRVGGACLARPWRHSVRCVEHRGA
jgi:hypothetical protein